MESQKRKRNKSWLIIIGSLIFLIGLVFVSYDYLSNKNADKQDEELLEEFYNNEEENIESTEIPQEKEEVKEQVKINYIAVLKIPKINLERGLVDPNSYLNNVKYNLQWIDGTSMPDEENGNVIIAGHSGSARISYFRKLDKLVIGDDIFLVYKNTEYKYKVVDIYDIEKTGKASIKRNHNKSVVTLITCRHNTNKQIVVIAELI